MAGQGQWRSHSVRGQKPSSTRTVTRFAVLQASHSFADIFLFPVCRHLPFPSLQAFSALLHRRSAIPCIAFMSRPFVQCRTTQYADRACTAPTPRHFVGAPHSPAIVSTANQCCYPPDRNTLKTPVPGSLPPHPPLRLIRSLLPRPAAALLVVPVQRKHGIEQSKNENRNRKQTQNLLF